MSELGTDDSSSSYLEAGNISLSFVTIICESVDKEKDSNRGEVKSFALLTWRYLINARVIYDSRIGKQSDSSNRRRTK